MKPFEILKTFNKNDLNLMKGPLLLLLGFIISAVIIFPKPSKIYHGGYLTSCSCAGIKASPKATKGSMIGDDYCIGIPVKCEKMQILKNVPVRN